MNFLNQALSKLPMILLLIFAASGVAFGDYFAKLWSVNQKTHFYFLAIFGYFLSGFFFLPTLLRNGLVVASVIWSILSVIAFLYIGLVLFNETLSTRQIAGVVLGVLSLLILSI